VTPEGVQGWDRYAGMNNNPVVYTDPSGHKPMPPHHNIVIPIPGRDPTLTTELEKTSAGGIPDLTSWLLTAMSKDATSPTAVALAKANNEGYKVEAYNVWIDSVKGGSAWDYKVELNNAKITTIKLGNQILSYDTLANIHYGFVSRASGFSSLELQAGAGTAQILSHTLEKSYYSTYFDAPQDNLMIRIGVWMYDTYGDQTLTEDMLNQAFKQFGLGGNSSGNKRK